MYDTDPNYFLCVVIKLSKVRAKDKEVWPACLVRSWEELCTCATLKMVDTNRPTTNKSRGWVVFFKILTLGIERQVIKKRMCISNGGQSYSYSVTKLHI
jgi:hypothetical protein